MFNHWSSLLRIGTGYSDLAYWLAIYAQYRRISQRGQMWAACFDFRQQTYVDERGDCRRPQRLCTAIFHLDRDAGSTVRASRTEEPLGACLRHDSARGGAHQADI